ncbi:nitroreductase family protein [Desertimonas flava]|uniref:nitroreductase family protein n=1 Tax=Desertimonas flava TaxID=2064846 RepID=UPI000E34DE5A|nr:nitroreductase family protein [Desertimonas flava]
MTRAFLPDPLPDGLLDELVDLAARAPSAGKTQGWHLVVLEGADTARFWNVTLPAERRDGFGWPHLLDAPVIALPFADPQAYVNRYSEPDKARTGLGGAVEAWPAPYWTIDASMSLMTLLLGAEAAGLGALFFGVFRGEEELRADLGVPPHLELLGAVALGYPRPGADDGEAGRGRSATRRRRPAGEIVHRGGW